MQETWLEEDKRKEVIGRLNKEYEWKVKVATRENRKGRAKGGVVVGVKKKRMGKAILEE